jgi:hypothetical protein
MEISRKVDVKYEGKVEGWNMEEERGKVKRRTRNGKGDQACISLHSYFCYLIDSFLWIQ